MKYNFIFITHQYSGLLPIEKSCTITKRGIQLGKNLRGALNLSTAKFVRIGVDEEAKAACIMPSDQSDAFKAAAYELGGRTVAKKLLPILGRKPYVTVEDGVAILTPEKPEIQPEPKPEIEVKEPIPVAKERKTRGRPKKNEDTPYRCENCSYSQPIAGVEGRIKCDKHGHTKNFDYYCFYYEPKLK